MTNSISLTDTDKPARKWTLIYSNPEDESVFFAMNEAQTLILWWDTYEEAMSYLDSWDLGKVWKFKPIEMYEMQPVYDEQPWQSE